VVGSHARGTPREEILDPEFWPHVARQLQPLDEIIAVDDDCTFRLRLIIVDAWVNGRRCRSFKKPTLCLLKKQSTEVDCGPRGATRITNGPSFVRTGLS
jgi:hypothetical protein